MGLPVVEMEKVVWLSAPPLELLYPGEHKGFDQALEFAKQAHGTQVRKHTGEPYWHHVYEVARWVSWTQTRQIEDLQAALLHDVIEDTPVTYRDLQTKFGMAVADKVHKLSDGVFGEPPVGNRDERRARTRRRLLLAPNDVKTIKVADQLSNLPKILKYDPNFGRVYLIESMVLLPCLYGADMKLFMQLYRGIEVETARGERRPGT